MSVHEIEEIINDSNPINSPMYNINCSVCENFITAGSWETSDIVYKHLIDNGYKFVDGKLYCPTCYEQYVKLQTIISKDTNNEIPIKRPSKINYYLDIAKSVSTRSTCLRKKYGSVIVKNDVIISTGYNGAPRGTKNCDDLQYCRREQMNIPRGQCYELCRSVHSEMNAIINAEREKMIGATLYLYGTDHLGNLVENLDSCQLCKKIIINSGIEKVVFARPDNKYVEINVSEWTKHDETLTDKMGY